MYILEVRDVVSKAMLYIKLNVSTDINNTVPMNIHSELPSSNDCFLETAATIAKIKTETTLDIITVMNLYFELSVIKFKMGMLAKEDTKLVDTTLPTAKAFTGIIDIIIFFSILPSKLAIAKTSNTREYMNIPIPSNDT